MLRNTALKLLAHGDLVLYKLDFAGQPRPGYVRDLTRHEVDIEDARTERRHLICPGQKGKVYKPHGAELVKLLGTLQSIRSSLQQRAGSRGSSRKRSAPPAPTAKLVPHAATPPVHAPQRQPLLRPEPRGTVPQHLPAPAPRLEDPRYLAWLRTLDCDGCGPHQRTQTEAAHNGPRGVGTKADDYRCNPLCSLCHRQHHRWRTLPGLTPEQSMALLYQRQVYLLLRYFAVPLGALAERWYLLAELADGMDLDGKTEHYTTLLDLMVQPLSSLSTRKGVAHAA